MALAVPNPQPLRNFHRPSPSLYPLKFEARQTCAATCGTVCYYQTAIDRAVDEGCALYQAGETEGSNIYPHAYNDNEGFDFPVSGPYQEFPILNNFDEYDGGSPGPDRVIFNTRCELAGVITHTSASGNGFVDCQG